MSHFYLTLPSNSSMDYYPENTVARYTTKLGNAIELEGDWEVGLLEMSTPLELVNIVEERCYYIIYVNRRYHNRISIPTAYYRSIRPLLNDMHRQQRTQAPIPDGQPLMVQFQYSGRKVALKLDPGHVHGEIAVRFSEDLANILGFNDAVRYALDTTAPRIVSLNLNDIFSMYVYCDLVEHVVVGDTKVPLLRIVDKPLAKNRHMHTIFNPMLYVPLQKKNFDTVEINIMTDTGEPMPFRAGKSFVVLEFRRTIHPYLAL